MYHSLLAKRIVHPNMFPSFTLMLLETCFEECYNQTVTVWKSMASTVPTFFKISFLEQKKRNLYRFGVT